MPNEIDKVATPALPLAPEGYERPYMDQNSNVLRLVFQPPCQLSKHST